MWLFVKPLPDHLDILRNRGNQLLDTGKLLFVANLVDKFHSNPLTVEITLKIEQMHL